MNDQSLVKMPDGTIKKFFGRKHKHLAKKYVEEHEGSKVLVPDKALKKIADNYNYPLQIVGPQDGITFKPKVPVSKIDKIILPDGKILDGEGKPKGQYRFEYVKEYGNLADTLADFSTILNNMKK